MIVNFVDVEESLEQSCYDLLHTVPCDIEDKRATEILNKTVKKVGNHNSVGLLWKEENPQLPYNRDMVLQRLQGMKKRFTADPQLFEKYRYKMQEHVDCGYAMLVP